MKKKKFKNIVEQYLAPVLNATVLDDVLSSPRKGQLVAYKAPSELTIKPTLESDFKIVLFRRPGFSSEERTLAEDFIAELLAMHTATTDEYKEELMSFLPMRAICRHLGGFPSAREILAQYDKWASRTYEGGAIAASIGVGNQAHVDGVSLGEMFLHDFSAVLTNGFDTLLVVSKDGHVAGAGQLENDHAQTFAPYRLGSIATWADEGKIAFVLNRLGEQLIFREKKLLFAKRRGEWSYYPHETYIKQMVVPQNKELREAIYESCIDVSFVRSGGCLGVVRSGSIDLVSPIISDEDRLDLAVGNTKTKVLEAMVGKRFQELDRRLRQELLALDGATLLSHKGDVLAVGAIIKVPAGSDGGGRKAAALEISQLGLGIKISEDGEISAFANKAPVFTA